MSAPHSNPFSFSSRGPAWPWLLACIWWSLVLALFSPTAFAQASTASTNAKPATIQISGYGFLGNRELRRILRTVELGGKKPQYLEPAFVEDAALILAARVKRDGYLRPRMSIRLRLADGGQMQVQAEDLLDNPLPRPLRITGLHFYIHKGVFYYFEALRFEGLETLSEKQARSYFVPTEILLNFKRSRLYTPERLQSGLASMTDVLDRQGYQEAKVEASAVQLDDRTGAANVRIRVQQGARFIVRSVREAFFYEGATNPIASKTVFPHQPMSRLWLQDFSLSLKTNLFHQGYPDATVEVQTLERKPEAGRVLVDLQADARSGPKVWIGEVRFAGEQKTRRGLMARRVRVHRGELLDRIRVEEGRHRLAQLGVFDTVDLNYEKLDEHTREVIYQVKEGKRFNVSLLFGYGSYELLRGGFEVQEYNIWGLAHQARLRAVQSFKSSSGEFTYTIPELVGNDIDLFFNASGLRREEISFTRLEYGGGMGLHKYFKEAATDVSTRYNYQILSALDLNSLGPFPAVASEGLTNPAVGSIITELKHDRRDSPLYPRRGYRVNATFETATEYLGGVANYQRIELSPSWHHRLGGGRFVSLGVSQGVDVSFGSPQNNLPFNKRFFPGGANSIRGYQEGEASPRNAFGQFVGAETYTLGTVELEQALTPKWSVVLFSDSLGMARQLEAYPWDTGLFSVGGGVRWRTIIGPVRLEYGHNLNPRPGDPSGTVHFSLGFPF